MFMNADIDLPQPKLVRQLLCHRVLVIALAGLAMPTRSRTGSAS
jgi:hypothetical protein